MPEFKEWLEPHRTKPNLCKCISCNKILKCGKSELLRHAASKEHQKFIKVPSKVPRQQISKLFEESTLENKKKEQHEKKIKAFELMLSACFAVITWQFK